MYDLIVIILIVFGVIAVASLIFGAWLLVVIARGLGRAFGLFASRQQPPDAGYLQQARGLLPPPRPGQVWCDRQRCHATNPDGVGFCRRCGSQLNGTTARQQSRLHERSRRAAML